MATIRTNKTTGSKSIQIRLSNGRRKTIGIRTANQKAAQSYCHHIGHLEASAIAGSPIPSSSSQWLSGIPDSIRRRLEELRLAPKNEGVSNAEAVTVSQLVEQYLGDQLVKPRTVVRYRNQLRLFKVYFKDVDDVRGLTVGDGKRFVSYLSKAEKSGGSRYATNTVKKMLKTSRQVFTYAVDNKLMDDNILDGLGVNGAVADERVVEISVQLVNQMLSQAGAEYKMIIALARWGGLRCPSELVGLHWSNFDWENGKFLVRSPKTEHQGKAERFVPIFPELKAILWPQFQARGKSRSSVFRSITAESNLRTQIFRILKEVGYPDGIPRFFQNCRSTRQTELEKDYSLHTVCQWMGNSELVAKKYYLKTRDSDFLRASGLQGDSTLEISQQGSGSALSASDVPQSVLNPTEPSGTEMISVPIGHEKTLEIPKDPAFKRCSKYIREDSNLQPPVPKF